MKTEQRLSDEEFAGLLSDVEQATAYFRGEAQPSRAFEYRGPSVKALRERDGISQSEFAAAYGLPVRTVQDWEQGQRQPVGPARLLLAVIERHPDVVKEAAAALAAAPKRRVAVRAAVGRPRKTA